MRLKTIFSALLAFVFLAGGFAYAGPYRDSAHGDTSIGVKRSATGFPTDYIRGSCAHCHEQHASIGGDEPEPDTGAAAGPDKFCIFAQNFDVTATQGPYFQDDNFCFYCHTNVGSLQYCGITGYNYDYSRTFGGAAGGVAGIFEAFNLTSYHNLNEVLDFAKGEWSSTFTTDSNPCAACHNVHIAKRNKANPGNPAYTAISKPSAHDALWGDDSPGERMTAAAHGDDYQPPYKTSPNLEPDGVGTDRAVQAGKTPNYVEFCQDCHATNMGTGGGAYDFGLDNTPIDWSTTGGESGGDKHGKNPATSGVDLIEPFASAWDVNGLVLSCLDCHEPHGSASVMLIRRRVNGVDLTGTISPFNNVNWKYLCERCHDVGTSGKLEDVHHTDAGAPYNQQHCAWCHGSGSNRIPCDNCHVHGGDDSWAAVPTGRLCF
ncbi:MAG: hypothetical protein SVS15_06710 [Thermodesulfobacteriota bacterium]|nr:hypothetical protein [Thermodesulfobacteriota bacterium]